MATTTIAQTITTSTSNTNSYATASFTPALNDLLVVFVLATATVLAAPTLTDSVGATFTLITSATGATSSDTFYLYVSNSLVAASARTLTFDCTGDNATGVAICTVRVSGMTKTGQNGAVKQTKQLSVQTAGTPAPAFTNTTDTNNVTIGVVVNLTSPATMTTPTSWTEIGDVGFSNPTSGMEAVTRDSGFAGTTVTWGSSSASNYGVMLVELNTTVSSLVFDPVPLQHILVR